MTSSARARRGVATLRLVLTVLMLALAVLFIARLVTKPRAVSVGGGAGGGAGRQDTARTHTGGVLVMPVKPTPVQMPDFHGCPPEGDSPRAASLNRRKNRVDEGDYRGVPFDTLLALPWPRTAERRMPDQWSARDRDSVEKYEGIPVAVEGYLAGAKEAGPESPNCHGADDPFQDWHVWLTGRPGEERTRSIVVEPTPRVREKHPGWTLAKLRTVVRDSTRVRISGWLMLDPEHPDQVGKTRGTIWEIHPVTRIDVQRRGGWVSLDSGSAASSRRARSRP